MKRSDAFFAPRTKQFTFALAALLAILISAAGPWASSVRAQGSRKDDVVFNSRGQPLAGAQVRVCASNATTTSPCTPLASVYSDPALTQALANPFTTDGMGNYNFYAAPGRYVIEIAGPGITTRQIRDVIVPNDPSSPTFSSLTTTSGINAFTLSLSGNLTVAGSAAITGSLTVGGAPVPSVNQANTWTAAQQFNVSTTFKGPSPWHDIVAYGAPTNGTSDAGPAFNAAWLAANADPGGTIYIPPNANGFLINTCPSVPTTSTGANSHVRILQAAPITFGSGCPTWNLQNVPTSAGGGSQGITWEGVASGSLQNADTNGPTATIQSSNNATLFDFVVDSAVTFRGLDIRCNNAGLTTPCVEMDHGASGTGSGFTMDRTNIFTNGTSTSEAFFLNGLTGAGAFQILIRGGAYAVTSANAIAGATAIQMNNSGGIRIEDVHLIGAIKMKYIHGQAAPVADVLIENCEWEATLFPIVLDSDSVAGTAGITGVTVINPLIADSPVGGAAIQTLGVNNISEIKVIGDLSGTTANFQQNDAIGSLFYFGPGTLTDTSMVVAGSAGCVFGGGNGADGCWGPHKLEPAFFVGTGTLQAGVSPTAGISGGNDAHHFYDTNNGGNGIAYSSLPFGNNTIARFDGAGGLAAVTLESADSTLGLLQFISPTHGSGYVGYSHQTGQKSILLNVEGNNLLTLYGSAQGGQAANSAGIYGDLHIETAGGTNGFSLNGSPTAFRSIALQDASGVVAFTGQLPLAGTTGSIGGSSLAAGACTTGTASVTGATTSMAVAISPASDPGTGFTWNAWVSSAGTVTARVCNVSAAAATPTAVAYNVRAVQ